MDPIQAEGLSKRYRRRVVVDRFDLRVPAGCSVALIGPNGAGKTTALKMLLGLIQPDGGRARLLGHDVRAVPPETFQRVGFVSEDQPLPGWLTVKGFLDYLQSLHAHWDERFAATLLDRFDLAPDAQIRSLSRGMRAKLRMLGAVAFRPELLVIDELFSGLDPLVRLELIDGMLSTADEEGWSVLFTTHELTDTERLADQVVLLYDGRTITDEPTEVLLERHRWVDVECSAPPDPASPDPAWIDWQTAGTRARFLATDADADLERRVRSTLIAATEVVTRPASLRDIFVGGVRSLGGR